MFSSRTPLTLTVHWLIARRPPLYGPRFLLTHVLLCIADAGKPDDLVAQRRKERVRIIRFLVMDATSEKPYPGFAAAGYVWFGCV